MCEQHIERASVYASEQRTKVERRRQRDRRRREIARHRKSFGKTATGMDVNLDLVQELESLGWQFMVVAEAVRRSGNERQAAMELLLNPDSLLELESEVAIRSSRERGRSQQRRHRHRNRPSASRVHEERAQVNGQDLQTLTGMGFDEESSRIALVQCRSVDAAIADLVNR